MLYELIVSGGTIDEIKEAIKQGADMNEETSYGNHVLLSSFKRPDEFEVFKLLVDNGSDIHFVQKKCHSKNTRNSYLYNWNILHSVCCITPNIDIIQYLINNSVDINGKTGEESPEQTPLMIASKFNTPEIVRFLIKNGADVNAKDKNGCDALYFTALSTKKDVIEKIDILCENGAVITKNKHGETALHRLARTLMTRGTHEIDEFPIEIARKLISIGTNINEQDDSGDTPLHIYMRYTPEKYKDISSVFFLNQCVKHLGADPTVVNKNGYTPFDVAVSYQNIKMIKCFLELGVNPNTNGQVISPLATACKTSNVELIEILIKHGANIDGCPTNNDSFVSDDYRRNPLCQAIMRGDTEVVRLLINKGADVNCNKYNYVYPFLSAVRYAPHEIIRLLVKHGADVLATDEFGDSALSLAFQNKEVWNVISYIYELPEIKKVIKNNDATFNIFQKAIEHNNFWAIQKLVEMGADIKVLNWDGAESGLDAKNLLHIALINMQEGGKGKYADDKSGISYCPIIEYLINSGVDINHRDIGEKTPLLSMGSAILRGGDGTKENLFLNMSSIEYLVSKGADVTAKEKQGLNILHYLSSVEYGEISAINIENIKKIFTIFTSAGADINDRDIHGWTPLFHALTIGEQKIVDFLLEQGANINELTNNKEDIFVMLDKNKEGIIKKYGVEKYQEFQEFLKAIKIEQAYNSLDSGFSM